jgi:hypothetical protein
MEEEKDQSVEEPEEGNPEQKSEDTKEEPSLEKVAELTKGLQKGYTLTRQDISEMKGQLQTIADAINQKSGVAPDNEEYLTVGKLREILSQQSQVQSAKAEEADKYIDATLTQLRAEGVVTSQKDEDDLLNFALKIKETDLTKAAQIYQEIKSAREEGKKEVIKTKTKQEVGSKVGTSSKNTGEESSGVDIQKLQQFKRDFGF